MPRITKQARVSPSSRFAKATQADVNEATRPVYAGATVRSAESAWKAFCEWRKCSGPLTKEDLGLLLSRFTLEHRREDGTDYKSGSLKTIMRSVVRKGYLLAVESGSQLINPWRFDDDNEFSGARNALDRRMGELQKKAEDRPQKATPFNQAEIDRAFDLKELEVDTPRGLVSRLYFVIGLTTAARIEWHVNARWSEISEVKETQDGIKYRTIPVGIDKNHPGGRNFETDSYFLIENKCFPERCPLELLKKYEEKRPKECPDRLYLGAVSGWNKEEANWYRKQPMGINTIAKIVPSIAVGIGIDVREADVKYSNHSLRATLPTILYQSAFDEQLISVVTKHKSLHGVRSYKRTSVKLLASAINRVTSGMNENSSLLARGEEKVSQPLEKVPESEGENEKEIQEERAPTSKENNLSFQGCTFTNCSFS